MKTSLLQAAIWVSGFMLTVGCVSVPPAKPPVVVTPANWKESNPATSATASHVSLPAVWWSIFHDGTLDALETQAVAANPDLRKAAARVAEVRALARLSEAENYPTITADASHSRFRTSGQRAQAPGPALSADDNSAQLGLSYELDFWGRVRNSRSAARAEALSAEDDYQVALLLLTTETAAHYCQLRSLDAERLILEATLTVRRDAVGLQETRNHAGLINEVDLARARTEVANVEAEIHALSRTRARLEHSLAVLCGQPPAGFSIAALPSPLALPAVPAGLPSTLLQRRPDLASAEQQLRAAAARAAVANTDRFPRLSLTGAAGFASADLSSLVESSSRAWSFGPSLYFPLFDGGRNRANLRAAYARYDQSVALYQSTILTAFREVEDSLSDLTLLAMQAAAVNRALISARDTVNMATERYRKGLSSYLEVVDAQRDALQAERLETQLDRQRILSTILLAKAMGGGWESDSTAASL